MSNTESEKAQLSEIDDITVQDNQETQKIEYEVIIIEEKNNNEKEEHILNNDDNNNNNSLPNVQDNKYEMLNNQNVEKNNISSTTQKISNKSVSTETQYLEMSNNSQTMQATYKGSDNNYLKELSIESYGLNKEFSKDNTTYFITVENEIEKIEVYPIADDNNATIIVYGNENLKEGTNKVLISVTAENGNVRNYRIYVTRKA